MDTEFEANFGEVTKVTEKDYSILENKPTIEGKTIEGNMSLSEFGFLSADNDELRGIVSAEYGRVFGGSNDD